ncbi:MAG: MaoC/PaaZ C-terminal domain-containing protein [Deltaproteobacteria bacterium]|nr:MaoC/PaaZ C-terminal domain-containing protein [Deltaproteobacteria bacterium]
MEHVSKPINPQAVGQKVGPLLFSYRWQDAALYALGIGAGPDDLPYVYEGAPGDPPMRVYPSFALTPAYEACKALFEHVGGDFSGVLHGAQILRAHRPLPPQGTLSVVGMVQGIWDLRRLAQVVLRVDVWDEQGSALLAESEWVLLYLNDGGFGGAPPPKSPRIHIPEREPDWRESIPTSPSQALLYRLSGDLNPLHADPRVAQKAASVTKGRPILHGLCTYGIVLRTILRRECDNNPARFHSFEARFSRPVWPGDTILVSAWREGEKVLIDARTKEHPDEPILTNAWAKCST